jgi:hypothetical protein
MSESMADAAPEGGLLTLDGSFNSLPLRPQDGVGYVTRLISGPAALAGVRTEFVAVVGDRPSLCAASVVRPNETTFAITAQSGDDPFGPGRFAVGLGGQPGGVEVSVTRFGPSCLPADQYVSESGTVVITRVTADAVLGTFEVTLAGDAGTLQGSFDVPLCAQPAARCTP